MRHEKTMEKEASTGDEVELARFRDRVTAYFDRVNSKRGLVNAYYTIRSQIVRGIRIREKQLKVLDEVYSEFLKKFGGEGE